MGAGGAVKRDRTRPTRHRPRGGAARTGRRITPDSFGEFYGVEAALTRVPRGQILLPVSTMPLRTRP